MKEFIKIYLTFSIKKILLDISIIFLLTFLQFYLSMGKFSDSTSSGCLDCSFFEDIIFLSFFLSISLNALFYFFSIIKQKTIQITLQYISLLLVWFFWNYNIFVDRESSWSTYLFHEEINITIQYSFIPILILSSVLILIQNFIKNRERRKY